MVLSLTDRQRKDHLETWLPVCFCPTLPAYLQCYCLPLTSPGLTTTASAESQQCPGAPCPAKPSVSPSLYHPAYVSCDLWKQHSFSPLLLICFDQVRRCLARCWDLCEMIDWQEKQGSSPVSCYCSLSQHRFTHPLNVTKLTET